MVTALLEEPMTNDNQIPQDMLKKYVLYAKRAITPKLADIDKEKITQFYTELRKEAAAVGGLPIGVRHVESILRMAESHARMYLRDFVRPDDVDMAIEMMLRSFLMSQKYAVARSLEKHFSQYLRKNSDPDQYLLNMLNRIRDDRIHYLRMVNADSPAMELKIPRTLLEQEAKSHEVYDVSHFLTSHSFKSKYALEGTMIVPK